MLTIGGEMTNANGNKPKVPLGAVVALVSVLSGGLGSIVTYVASAQRDQQQQTDSIMDLQKRVTKLEDLAEKTTESRIRMEEQLDQLNKNQIRMLSDVDDLKRLVRGR